MYEIRVEIQGWIRVRRLPFMLRGHTSLLFWDFFATEMLYDTCRSYANRNISAKKILQKINHSEWKELGRPMIFRLNILREENHSLSI